ncbi:MAG: hypothetical protein E6746_05225 [Peptoniphilus lacydonensis]|uniref:hypothetical protein n=1 Tax=Peptoniphilus lacydonensis TaxID=1673725 RepID=UPI0029014D93|nr:hypothetical protein [Peptoniphilus lacydonensis]MDU1954950.1 hypothetical protein [Peptoniphilus lacydonensis]
MTKKKSNIILAISILIPFSLSVSGMKNYMEKSAFLYSFMWAVVNYLFIMTAVDFIANYKKIKKLENLNINKKTYNLNIFVYLGFLILVNIYFLQQMYVKDVKIVDALSNPILVILVFVVFLINLQNGKFPQKEEKETDIYEIPRKSSFRDGNDKLGTVVGSYENGMILGNYHFSYDSMKSISESKDKELVIKGRENSKNYRINIGSENSLKKAKEVINVALKNEKIEKSKVNF